MYFPFYKQVHTRQREYKNCCINLGFLLVLETYFSFFMFIRAWVGFAISKSEQDDPLKVIFLCIYVEVQVFREGGAPCIRCDRSHQKKCFGLDKISLSIFLNQNWYMIFFQGVKIKYFFRYSFRIMSKQNLVKGYILSEKNKEVLLQ